MVMPMFRRSRSRVAAMLLASVAVFMTFMMSKAFLAWPALQQRANTNTKLSPMAIAIGAAALGEVPMPAYAGGMFDFGLTLPTVMFLFLLMMFVLQNLWYGPVSEDVDQRNEKIVQTLSEASETLKEADDITERYTEKINTAKTKAKNAVATYRNTTQASIDAQMQISKDSQEESLKQQAAQLREQVRQQKEAALPMIQQEANKVVREAFAAVGL